MSELERKRRQVRARWKAKRPAGPLLTELVRLENFAQQRRWREILEQLREEPAQK